MNAVVLAASSATLIAVHGVVDKLEPLDKVITVLWLGAAAALGLAAAVIAYNRYDRTVSR